MPSEVIICDTNVFSDLSLGKGRTSNMIDRLASSIRAISVVTIAEAGAGARSANWGPKQLTELESYAATYVQLGIDRRTARVWSEIRAECLKQGLKHPHNDLWIAATAIAYGYAVASLDEHFLTIPRIRLIPASGVEQRN